MSEEAKLKSKSVLRRRASQKAEKPGEAATQEEAEGPKDAKKVRFVSRGKHIRVMLKPSKTTKIDGQNVLLNDRIIAKFENGVFETADEETIKLAKENPACGVDYVCAE